MGSLIGFLAAWLIYRVYFADPFAQLPSRETGGDPRTVYTLERRDDGFMELNQLQEERTRFAREGQLAEEQV